MPLHLDVLECRECPAFLGSRDGWVIMPDQTDFVPFPDFMASHATAGDQYVTVIGAADGGGPRVQVREGGTVLADFFAFEETFRGGVNVAYHDGIIAVSPGHGGGPVVAVFDTDGNELGRWFAYEDDFRGGLSVAVSDSGITVVPGLGGGPRVRSFSLDGEILSDDFGSEVTARFGWSIVVGDVTHDRLADTVLISPTGIVDITEGVTGGRQTVQLPPGFTLAGYEGETLTVGNTVNYNRSRALWTSFPTMTEFEFHDAAAGNPAPPPTHGTRPGVYIPIQTVGSGPPPFEDFETFAVNVSDSVGTAAVGTGSSYVPMYDGIGRQYLVTASHVARRNPYSSTLPNLLAPGGQDGVPQLAGVPVSGSTIQPGTAYTVDAAAFAPSVTLTNDVVFDGMAVGIDGVAETVEDGEVLLSVGRGKFVGVGTVTGYQANPVGIRWPSGDVPQIAGQVIGQRGVVPLAVPGFSGGVCLVIRWTADGPQRYLVGMVVAGNEYYVFITPHAAIVQELGLPA